VHVKNPGTTKRIIVRFDTMRVLLELFFSYKFCFWSKLTKMADTLCEDLTCISMPTQTLSVEHFME